MQEQPGKPSSQRKCLSPRSNSTGSSELNASSLAWPVRKVGIAELFGKHVVDLGDFEVCFESVSGKQQERSVDSDLANIQTVMASQLERRQEEAY